jgi:hypothetical protein
MIHPMVSRIGAADAEKTSTGRELAEPRQRAMLDYLAALRAELGGEA